MGVIIGVAYLIVCVIRKKPKKIALFIIVGAFVLNVIGIETTPERENNDKKQVSTKEETKKSQKKRIASTKENSRVKVSNAAIITQVQYYVEKYDKIDNVEWPWNSKDYNIKKQKALISTKDKTIFDNVFTSTGTYSWRDKKYNYTITMNFPDKDSSQLIKLKTDMGTSIEVLTEAK